MCVSVSGFPVYDYELPITEEALNASIARINSQSWGPNLYGIFRSHVRNVSVLTAEVLYFKYVLLCWKTIFHLILETQIYLDFSNVSWKRVVRGHCSNLWL